MRKAFFAAFAAIIAFQILLPPIIGLANDGDFGKVVGLWGLGAPPESEYKYLSAVQTFDSKYKQWAGFLSSEQGIAGASIVANRLVSKDGRFDIRVIGVIHAVLYLGIWSLAAPLLPRRGFARIIVAIAVLLIFSDVFYASMFNTFYMDAAALLGLLAFSVGFLRAANGIAPGLSRVLMLAGAMILVTSKTQHALAGVCIAVALVIPVVQKAIGLTPRAARAAAALVVVSIGASLYWVPAYYRVLGAYNVIFYGLLPHSTNVSADLADLGLDDSYRPYIGTHAFMPTSGMQRQEFIDVFAARTSNVGLAAYYLRQPVAAFRILKNALNEAGRQRPALGNFDASAALPEFAESSAFSMWSGAKRRLFENRGGRYLWTSLVLFALGVASALRRGSSGSAFRGAGTLAALLAAMAVIEMLTSALVDVLDITRHFYMFSVLWDCLVLLLLAMATLRVKTPLDESG